jgi:DNA-binding beta-propeller fold protein YncE
MSNLHAPLLIASVLALVTACGEGAATSSAHATTGAGGAHTTSSATTPTTSTGSGTCKMSSHPATMSPSLNDWPAFTATTAPDMTSSLGVNTTATPSSPAGVLLTPDGQWALAAMPTGVAVLKRQGNALTMDHTIATAGSAFGLALSSDGNTVAASLPGAVALLDLAKATSNASGAITSTIAMKGKMGTIDVAFSHDGQFVFAALEYDNAVSVIDVKNHVEVGEIPIAGQAVTGLAVSPDGKNLYVVCEVAKEFQGPPPAVDQDVGKITVIDIATATTNPTGSVLGQAFVGRAPVRIILSNDGSTLWVSLRGSNAVVALDAANLLMPGCDPLLAEIAVGASPVGIRLFGGGLGLAVANSDRFATGNTNQTLMFLDVADALAGKSTAVRGQATVGAFPREIAADATGLVVSNFKSQSVSGMALPPP